MYKCPNKNLPEWKELERVVPEVAYTIWDKNNGHGIDKAPNGEPSILFESLLQHYGNNREEAIKAKSVIYSSNFIMSLDDIDQNGEPYIDYVINNDITYQDAEFPTIDENIMRSINEISNLYQDIQKGLKDRLNSIKRYSNRNPKVYQQLQALIQKLANSETEQGIIQFVQHINDTIESSIQFLSQPVDNINAKQIRQLSNDYVGFYKPLIENIQYILDTTDYFKDLDNYHDFEESVYELSSALNTINNRFINILKNKGYNALRDYLRKQGTPEQMISDTINWLDDPKHDSSIFINWFGMMSNSDNLVQQTIAKMLNDIKNQNEREVLEKGIQLVEILSKAKNKYGNDVQKLLYEKLDNGRYSGLRVTPLNYGQMRENRKNFIDKLGSKFGLQKDENGQYVLPQDETIQKKWFDEINKWYSTNADRQFIPEYYNLRNSILSMKTRDALNEIQNTINTILDPITINGVTYDNLLSEAEFINLQNLRKQKRLLSLKYNIDGSEKTGDDATIAKELREFNEKVGGGQYFIPDKERYDRDRISVERKYGSDSEQLNLWIQRNTKKQYTKEFYDRIDALEKVGQSQLYEELKQKRRELLSIYKNPLTGKVDVSVLTDNERADLLQLDKDIADLYQYKQKMQDESDQDQDKFSKFAEIAVTDEYLRDANQARLSGKYNEWYDQNHYEDSRGFMQPATYYTELRPKANFLDQYTEIVPSGRYTRVDPESVWYNNNWDPTGPAVQPNKKIYDNSKAYNAIINKPEVKALYDMIEQTMSEANKYISFLSIANDNRMPQIPAKFMQALSRKDGITSKLGYALEDIVTTKEDDVDFVKEFATMPNGDPIKIIPTRFIKMLEDTNTISTDAVASVLQYYNMAVNYKNMSNAQDDVELMLNLLKQLGIRTNKEYKQPGSTNIYKQAQLLVDRLMYGKNKTAINVKVAGKEINVAKTLDIVRGFITKVNLSGNIWSIGTSLFTDTTYTTIESLMGRFYDSEDLRFAVSEFNRQLPNMMSNIGNPKPKGKLPYLMMLNQVVKDNSELFDRLDQSQVLRSINQNFWFAGYTQADYTVKSHVLLSIYHGCRLVPGEGFMFKNEYIDKFYPNNRKEGAIRFKQLKITLYDAYQFKNGQTSIQDKYKDYINTNLLNNVKNRIEILSRRTDGTIREVDKAQVHANSIASYLVQHRNFMVSGLHDRFKKKQYNLDLGVVEEGWYRSTAKFLRNVIGQRHFALTQLLADYNNLQEYEQYAVRRVTYELMLIAASTTVAVTLASIVDGDDDYDNWVMQSVTYLAMRSAFEFRTMYNPFEFISMIKSPTAAFTWFDNASSFLNLINPYSYFGNRTPLSIIDRGVYEDMPVILRNIIKVTPFKSIFEAQDPKAKRNYLQNQLMNF